MKKIIKNTIKYIKQEYRFIITICVIILLFSYELPYVIYTPGGATNISNKVHVKNGYKSKGSLNGAYVKSIIPNLPFFLLAKIIPDWDLESKSSQVLENETFENMEIRSKMYLEEANSNAIIVALESLKIPYEIINIKNRIIYVYDYQKTDLIINDEIITVDGFKLNNLEDLQVYVNTKNVGDKIDFYVTRKKKKNSFKAEVFELGERKILGIMIATTYDVKSDYNIKIDIKTRESGPSGGLISALAVYDALTKEDLTKGNKIIGTGTIDVNGNVGSIGGVKHKLIGAVNKKAKIFIVPIDNYEEAIKIKKERNYKIKIYGVRTFEEALEVLRNN